MKRIVFIICTIFLGFIIFIGYKYFTQTTYISVEEAKQIAMNDVANIDNEYSFNTIEYKETNKTYIYILIFNDKLNSYTYKIDAKTKKIISNKKESLTNNKDYIEDNMILDIVLKHANLRKIDCNIMSNYVTLEDGIPTYNTIFYNQNTRYEYKTNAYTGSIISVIKLKENAS